MAFVQQSPNAPIPAGAGPTYNDAPMPSGTPNEAVQSTRIPGGVLGPTPPAPPPPPTPE